MSKKFPVNYIVRPMTNNDLDEAYAIEVSSYEFPWSENNFKNCLGDNYSNFII